MHPKFYNLIYAKQRPTVELHNSIQHAAGDHIYWNQVHGRKIYVHRMSDVGRYMIGCWRIYPKWMGARSAALTILVAALFFSCSTTVTVNSIRVKSPQRKVRHDEFLYYLGGFVAGYAGVMHFKPARK